MKKNLLWMLAAILLCGLTVTVFTACGDDDDDNNTPKPQDTPTEATSYDVTLTFMAFKSLTPYVTYEFSYTNHKGEKSGPIKISGNEKGEDLTANELEEYKGFYKLYVSENVPESKYLEYMAMHFTIKDVPTDGSISWETTRHKIAEATVPEEPFSYVWPSVMVTVKSGNKSRSVMNLGPGIVGESNREKWFENIIVGKDGSSVPYASGSIENGEIH